MAPKNYDDTAKVVTPHITITTIPTVSTSHKTPYVLSLSSSPPPQYIFGSSLDDYDEDPWDIVQKRKQGNWPCGNNSIVTFDDVNYASNKINKDAELNQNLDNIDESFSIMDERLIGYLNNDELQYRDIDEMHETSEIMLAVKHINSCLDSEERIRSNNNSCDVSLLGAMAADNTSDISGFDSELDNFSDLEEEELKNLENFSKENYQSDISSNHLNIKEQLCRISNCQCSQSRCSNYSSNSNPYKTKNLFYESYPKFTVSSYSSSSYEHYNGVFRARRTCYHYKPQVKRCSSLKKTFPSILFSLKKTNPQRVCKCFSQSINIDAEAVDQLYPKSSHFLKNCFDHSSNPNFSSWTNYKKIKNKHKEYLQFRYLRNVKICCTRMKSLTKRVRTQHNGYCSILNNERVFWRVSNKQLEKIMLFLIHYNDSNTLENTTPVSYSIHCLASLFKNKQTSYFDNSILASCNYYHQLNDEFSTQEWIVICVCLFCLIMFINRIFEGLMSCWLSVVDDFVFS